MISDEKAERAADYIRDNAQKYATAKAQRIYLSEYRKSLKALKMQECEEDKVSTRETYAYSHPDYLSNLEALSDAVEIEERIRWEMVAAEVKIDIWRTQQANNRRIDSSHS